MRTGLLIIIILFFTACKNKNAAPGGIIPQKKMQAVLWDMMRADQFLNGYVFGTDTSINKTTESLKYYQQVFALHNVSKEDFQQSLLYYKKHPLLLKAVLDSIAAVPEEAPTRLAQPERKITPVYTDTVKRSSDTANKAPGRIKSIPLD